MFDFPTIIIDDFFKQPGKLRDLGLKQDFNSSKDVLYSGKRTQCLSKIYPKIYEKILDKIILGCSLDVVGIGASMHFHITEAVHGSAGWVHTDESRKPGITCIAYLNNVEPSLNNGTSFFKAKDPSYITNPDTIKKMRESFKLNVDYNEEKTLHNKNFKEVLRVGEYYNRMLMFDNRQYHAGSGYYGDNKESARLTLITFISVIDMRSGMTPLTTLQQETPTL